MTKKSLQRASMPSPPFRTAFHTEGDSYGQTVMPEDLKRSKVAVPDFLEELMEEAMRFRNLVNERV